MRKKTDIKISLTERPLQIFLIAALFMLGLYYEYLSCAASIFLAGYLAYAWKRQGKLNIPKSITLLTVTVVTLAMAVTALWAVDKGVAVLGFVRFLPLLLFSLCAAQLSAEQRQNLLKPLPLAAAVLTVLAFALGLIPALKSFFFVNSRLAGFFEYPNVFALFLLLSFILVVSEKEQNIRAIAISVILLVGIFLTGSRTAFAILLVVVVWLGIAAKDKRKRAVLFGATAAIIAATGVYVVCTGNVSGIGRYFTTSLTSSTFLGRLLYFKDALPVILSHPFGLGYMGYHCLQGSFQTGVYSVVNIHNELLQLLLDVGWIPAAIAVFAVIRYFVRGLTTTRIFLFAAVAHCMMDFDLQYPAICMLLITVMMQTEELKTLKEVKKAVPFTVAAIACICVYFGVVTGFYYAGNYETTVKLYPGFTNAWEQLLTQTNDAETMDEIADNILSHNSANALANSAKARVAYSRGDFGKVIEYKERAIANARYSMDEYMDYASMLQVGLQLYTQNGDAKSAQICREKLLGISDMLKEVENSTSPLAWKLDEKPELTPPQEFTEFINRIS